MHPQYRLEVLPRFLLVQVAPLLVVGLGIRIFYIHIYNIYIYTYHVYIYIYIGFRDGEIYIRDGDNNIRDGDNNIRDGVRGCFGRVFCPFFGRFGVFFFFFFLGIWVFLGILWTGP